MRVVCLLIGFSQMLVGQPLQNVAHAADPYRSVVVLRSPLVVQGRSGMTQSTVTFRLPRGAQQAVHGWYILDATVRLELSGKAKTSWGAEVDILTDGSAASEVSLEPGIFGGQRGGWWSSFDLFEGASAGIVVGRTIVLHYRNYLQVHGVRPGENKLSLAVWQFGGKVITSAELLPGSRLAYGTLAPPLLRLAVSPFPTHMRVGETISLRYAVSSEGFPARDVGTVIAAPPSLMVMGAAPGNFLGWVGERDASVHFQALAPGTHRVTIVVRAATGAYGVISKVVSIHVVPK